MDIARVDSIATRGDSALHGVSPKAKLLAFALALSAVVVSSNLLVVISIGLALVAAAVAMRLPMRPMLALAAYPGLFAALFSLAAAPGILPAALIVSKAVVAALCALLLLFTTPYPQVFAPIQKLMPAVIGDALLMTYRSLFLLMERFSHVMTAARLRAGILGKDPLRSARLVTRSLAGVMIYSIDLSQRTYDVMQLRGYDGGLVVTPIRSRSPLGPTVVLCGGLMLALVSLAWRLGGLRFAPFAWLPVSISASLLLAASIFRALRPKDNT